MDLEDLYQERCKGRNGKWPDQAAMAEHLPFLRDLVEKTDAQQVIEVGVHTGQSTIAFLVGLQKTGGKLWSCDVEGPKEPIKSLEWMWAAGNLDLAWTFFQGDSSAKETIYQSPVGAEIAFIDGAFENRLTDLMIYGSFIEPGGFVLVHDTQRNDVREAVLTFLYLNPYHKLIQGLENGHGLAIIRTNSR